MQTFIALHVKTKWYKINFIKVVKIYKQSQIQVIFFSKHHISYYWRGHFQICGLVLDYKWMEKQWYYILYGCHRWQISPKCISNSNKYSILWSRKCRQEIDFSITPKQNLLIFHNGSCNSFQYHYVLIILKYLSQAANNMWYNAFITGKKCKAKFDSQNFQTRQQNKI